LIYIRTIDHYTDIDPTVDFVFPVSKIDRKNSDKNSFLEKLEATKCVFRSCNFWKLSTQFDEIIQFALKKLLMLIYVITILNIALITFIMIVNISSCDCLNYYRCQLGRKKKLVLYTCLHNNYRLFSCDMIIVNC
jgi:hypothetical protein